MNSSATSQGWSTNSECEIYHFLGGKLDQPTTEVYVVFLFLIVISIITCPITIALNALVIIAVKIKRRLRTRSNIALACLALTDELTALIGHPIFIAVTVSALQGENSSKICTLQPLLKNTLRLLNAASLYHMVLMNLERYIAIKHSFAYETLVTETRILGMSAITWIIVVIRIPLIIAGNRVYIQVSSILMFLSLATIIFCQIIVSFEAHRQEKLIAAQQISVEARQKFLKEKKAFKLTSIVLFILFLSYLPVVVVRILVVDPATNTVNTKQQNQTLVSSAVTSHINTKFIAFFTANFVLILNSLVNPVVYCLRIRKFRVAFIELVFCKSNSQAEDIERRLYGSGNVVVPLGEGEGQSEEHENFNSANNDYSNGSNFSEEGQQQHQPQQH